MRYTMAAATLLAFAIGVGAASAAAPKTLTVPMKAEHGSGENGTATLTQTAKGVTIVVDIKGAPAGAQPTHIHPGTCTKLNPAPEYPLSSIVKGKSTTTLSGVSLGSLMGGKFSINVHKSANDLADYVSCGEIK